jgi:hypothetical protein
MYKFCICDDNGKKCQKKHVFSKVFLDFQKWTFLKCPNFKTPLDFWKKVLTGKLPPKIR